MSLIVACLIFAAVFGLAGLVKGVAALVLVAALLVAVAVVGGVLHALATGRRW